MHTGTPKYGVILAKSFQHYMIKDHRRDGFIDKGKYKKRFMGKKWTDRQYHVQDNDAVELKYVRMYYKTNKFPVLSFFGPYSKPHGARGLSKHYHLRFDTKLGMRVCVIRCISCACIACTSILDKPWISGIPSNEQERYKPVIKCTYWQVLGSFKNWNIIQFSHKSTPYDSFDEIHQVVLDGISDNKSSLFESGKYGSIYTTDTTTNEFYVIIFISEAYKVQDKTAIDVHIITTG